MQPQGSWPCKMLRSAQGHPFWGVQGRANDKKLRTNLHWSLLLHFIFQWFRQSLIWSTFISISLKKMNLKLDADRENEQWLLLQLSIFLLVKDFSCIIYFSLDFTVFKFTNIVSSITTYVYNWTIFHCLHLYLFICLFIVYLINLIIKYKENA